MSRSVDMNGHASSSRVFVFRSVTTATSVYTSVIPLPTKGLNLCSDMPPCTGDWSTGLGKVGVCGIMGEEGGTE